MHISWPLYAIAAPGIAGGAWLLGVPGWLALLCGAFFGLVVASPDLRGDRWVRGQGPMRPSVPALPSDPLPPGGLRRWPFLAALPCLLAFP